MEVGGGRRAGSMAFTMTTQGCNLTQWGDKVQVSRSNTDTSGYKGARHKLLAALAAKTATATNAAPEIRNNGIPFGELRFGVSVGMSGIGGRVRNEGGGA